MRLLLLVALLLAAAPLTAQPPPEDGVVLRADVRADEEYAICLRLLRQARGPEGRGCLERVAGEHPDTTAALRAQSVLSALPPEPGAAAQVSPPSPIPFQEGHLLLATSAGAFGVWSGAVGAIALVTNPNIVPAWLSVGGGAAAVALGGTLAVGSWMAADRLDASPGDARLSASGIAWGTGLGLAVAPWMFALAGSPWPEGALPPIDEDFDRALPLALLPTVAGGLLGLGGAALLATVTELEPAQVSTLNTGGWVGFAVGLSLTPFLGLLGFGDPLWAGLLYLGSTTTGLLGGFGASQLLKLDLWEVFVIDAATLTTFAVIGGGAWLLRSGGPPSQALDVAAGGAAAVGTLVGLVGSTAAVAFFRVRRGERASRVGGLPFDVLFAPPSAALDMEGQLVPMASVLSLRF